MKIFNLFWNFITLIAVISFLLYVGIIGVLPTILALISGNLWVISLEAIAIPVACITMVSMTIFKE